MALRPGCKNRSNLWTLLGVLSPAEKIAFAGNSDETGDVTLLALVHTVEGTPGNSYMERSYITGVWNDSVFVETEFEWLPGID